MRQKNAPGIERRAGFRSTQHPPRVRLSVHHGLC